MGNVVIDMSMSSDGYIAAPNDNPEQGLGEDGMRLSAWLTTVVGRVCLDTLRSRRSRGEEPLAGRLPDLLVDRVDGIDPEHEALLADSVGLALLFVLETLSPPERLAFVLHDIFAVPFDEIAPIVDRSPEAARQLASRARRRMRAERTVPDADLETQREVADAFIAAARDGDFDRSWRCSTRTSSCGPISGRTAARRSCAAQRSSRAGARLRPARAGHPAGAVNGVAGAVAFLHGQPFSIAAVTVRNGKIVEFDFLNDRSGSAYST